MGVMKSRIGRILRSEEGTIFEPVIFLAMLVAGAVYGVRLYRGGREAWGIAVGLAPLVIIAWIVVSSAIANRRASRRYKEEQDRKKRGG